MFFFSSCFFHTVRRGSVTNYLVFKDPTPTVPFGAFSFKEKTIRCGSVRQNRTEPHGKARKNRAVKKEKSLGVGSV